MWISYSDSEVKRFHPICERALKLALALIGKEKKYAVLHHQSAGSLEMDYAVQNKATGKYLIRNIDQIWANELFGEDSEHALYTSKRMLEHLVSRRNP